MFKKILIYSALVFLCLSFLSSADLGFKLGVNSSDFFFSSEENNYRLNKKWDKTSNIQIGVFYRISLFKNIDIQPELHYSESGAKTTGLFWGDEISMKQKLSYLKLPVLVKFNFINLKNINAGIIMGPYFAYNIKSRTIFSYKNDVVDDDVGDQIKKIDYGLIVGANLKFKNFIFDFRFSVGGMNLSADEKSYFDIKNNGTVFLIGYQF